MKIVLTSIEALLQKTPPKDNFSNFLLHWKKNEKVEFEKIPKILRDFGYERVSLVTDKGQFCIRGGILDIFPTSSIIPFRVEFFADNIESIRSFNPGDQKSIKKVENIKIFPAKDFSQNCSLLDYFEKEPIIIYDDLTSIEDSYISYKSLKNIKTDDIFFNIFDRVEKFQTIFLTKDPIEKISKVKILPQEKSLYFEKISFEFFQKEFFAEKIYHPFIDVENFIYKKTFQKDFSNIFDTLLPLVNSKIQIYFVTEFEEKIKAKILENFKEIPKNFKIFKNYLNEGFGIDDANILILTDFEIFHKTKIRRQKLRASYHTAPSDFHTLEIGEMVVHFHSGIGKFLGIEKHKNHLGIDTEFLIIEYAKNSKLFVPASQAHLVSRYIGSKEESSPKLSTIGSTKWQKTKLLAEKKILGYASELLDFYAQREIEGGIAYPEDSEDFINFEEEFAYVETEDQLKSISEIKQDMMSKNPMERLICGDVGYGKTEVAIRAAFKAVFDGKKQVAILVPTTVLAMQHFENFKERMSTYPIVVEHVSRFNTVKKNKQIIQNVIDGKVDILIGTHRLLSKDVFFKNLGLIIIDEEQRFGVRAKEGLKKLKKSVDCLYLSATPIPRTLYMSLINIKAISTINTPPQDRLPIKSILAEFNEEVVKEAILREFSRDGQVFIIHNRVDSIFKRLEFYKKLIPTAKIIVVHGQMRADDIDKAFHLFKNGEANILLSTTIIENGVDIPNANTILIENADNFGLSDLYQLRGRVGRWNKLAYAYFLTAKKKKLSKIAKKRLTALLESGGYGGGMKIAMRDLEIRGAGDILGTQQSGQISNIGFHLYCRLLKKTILAIKNKQKPSFIETKIDFPYPASLPTEYINDSSIRMELYNRLGSTSTYVEIDQIISEIKDRFGKDMPDNVLWLSHMTRIKLFLCSNNFYSIKFEKNTFKASQKYKGKILSKIFPLPTEKVSPKELEDFVITALKQTFKCFDL